MNYKMYRVFCAAPGDLEPERQTFHDAIGQINEDEGIHQGTLFVPVTILPNMVDTGFYRSSVEENIHACAFFVQVLDETWGPSTRNFEWKYVLACKLRDDKSSPMEDIAVFFKERDGQQVETAVRELKASLRASADPLSYDFESLVQFKEQLRSQLSAWLRNLTAQVKAS